MTLRSAALLLFVSAIVRVIAKAIWRPESARTLQKEQEELALEEVKQEEKEGEW